MADGNQQMRAQTAPLGIAALLAFSTAASALPCAHTASERPATTLVVCTAESDNGGVDPSVETGREPATSGDPLASDADEAVEPVELGAFVEKAVKITNLQATMTSNTYIAGHIPPVRQASSTEELMMNAPDYMSVTLLPRIPTRKPVGVGLVTLPKPVKKSDTPPGAEHSAKPTP